MLYDYMDVDILEAPHGRAPALATGIKRSLPDRVVFTYQGDGDLASIGMGEIVHAANRGENITVVFVNNTTYGMTGGQMAPPPLLGQKTTTSPFGRDFGRRVPDPDGRAAGGARGRRVFDRVTVSSPAHIRKAKEAIARGSRCS
jgi:2-oxoglutarate ferredoxin oxidoreductase subunit beta